MNTDSALEEDQDHCLLSHNPARFEVGAMRIWLLLLVGITVGVVGTLTLGPNMSDHDSGKSVEKKTATILSVKEPPFLSGDAKKGKRLFELNCIDCHGKSGRGSTKGPPLVMYDEDHHDDEAFARAVRNGVLQHHWQFGNMPAIPGITNAETRNIISYVREIQAFEPYNDGSPH